MKKLAIVVLVMSVWGHAQVETYEQAYRQAMKDGVITVNEQEMLDVLQKSLGLTEDDVLSVQERFREKPEAPLSLSQEGRWWIIAQNMLLGNGLYGNAIPHVLGIENEKIRGGLHLLAFSGGYFVTSSYTKKIDIPMGRAFFQNTGAELGLLSGYSLMALVGFERWDDFDPDAKIFLTYEMVAAPVGIWQADRLFRKWNPTNGQASMISQSVALGAFNAWGLYSLITDIPDDPSENWLRVGIPFTYAGALASAYCVHQYVHDKSYSRGDASFVLSGAAVGLFSCFEFLRLFEFDTYRSNMLTALVCVNGFTWFANRLTKSVDLTLSNSRIISLGTLASYLAWSGSALILDVDYGSDAARVMDLVSVIGGWYLTYTKTAKRIKSSDSSSKESSFTVNWSPTLLNTGKTWVLGMQMSTQF